MSRRIPRALILLISVVSASMAGCGERRSDDSQDKAGDTETAKQEVAPPDTPSNPPPTPAVIPDDNPPSVVWERTRNASGGDIRGNGGDAVVCRDEAGSIVSAEVLDYYEARILRGATISLGEPTASVDEKIATALTRLGRLDPSRAAVLREWASDFFSNAVFVDAPLTDLPDHGDLLIGTNCKVEQAAINRQPRLPGDRWFLISNEIWAALDHDQRAGLVLHEVIFRDAVYRHLHVDSASSRYLNALIGTTGVETWSQSAYDELKLTLWLDELLLWDRGNKRQWKFLPTPILYQDAFEHCEQFNDEPDLFRVADQTDLQDHLVSLGGTALAAILAGGIWTDTFDHWPDDGSSIIQAYDFERDDFFGVPYDVVGGEIVYPTKKLGLLCLRNVDG